METGWASEDSHFFCERCWGEWLDTRVLVDVRDQESSEERQVGRGSGVSFGSEWGVGQNPYCTLVVLSKDPKTPGRANRQKPPMVVGFLPKEVPKGWLLWHEALHETEDLDVTAGWALVPSEVLPSGEAGRWDPVERWAAAYWAPGHITLARR